MALFNKKIKLFIDGRKQTFTKLQAEIAETDEAKGVAENAVAGKKGGKIAKDARLALEKKTGKKVITKDNFLPPEKEVKNLKK